MFSKYALNIKYPIVQYLNAIKCFIQAYYIYNINTRNMAASSLPKHTIDLLQKIKIADESEQYRTECEKNRYSKHNPEGVICMATSQNQLNDDIVVQKINECLQFESKDMHYFPFRGLQTFRANLAKLFGRHMNPVETLNPDNLVVMNGGSSTLDMIGGILCDPGDAMIIPAPYYNGFVKDLAHGRDIVLIPALVEGKATVDGDYEGFRLTTDILEGALLKAKQENVHVRALLTSNPQNPLGIVYTEEEVRICMNFCNKHKLHFVSDEFYIMSIFNAGTKMTPALSLSNLMDPNYLHVVWGFSKDFSLSGIRCAVLYTRNIDVLTCATYLDDFSCTPRLVHSALDNMLNDEEWVESYYLPTSKQRLLESHDIVTTTLKDLGIPHIKGEAGFFIWCDFSQFLPEPTMAAEVNYMKFLIHHGIFFWNGNEFCNKEPGWFRMIFPIKKDELEIGLQRLRKAVEISIKNKSACSVN